MTVYRWKPKTTIGVDAQAAGEELDRIRERNGGTLSQEAIVVAAKEAKHVLHPAFEWRDKVAAHQYRLHQAGHMIRSIVVVKPSRGNEPETVVRAYVSVTPEEEKRPTYVTVADAMSDAGLRRQVLDAALRDLAAWRARYRELHELAEVFAAADRLITAA